MRNGTELFLQVSFLPIDDVDFIFFYQRYYELNRQKDYFNMENSLTYYYTKSKN